MKIVIDISEDFYTDCKEWVADYCANIEQTIIAEGTPLLRGKWIKKGYKPCGICSVCGKNCDINYFCGNCGADMRGNNNAPIVELDESFIQELLNKGYKVTVRSDMKGGAEE